MTSVTFGKRPPPPPHVPGLGVRIRARGDIPAWIWLPWLAFAFCASFWLASIIVPAHADPAYPQRRDFTPEQRRENIRIERLHNERQRYQDRQQDFRACLSSLPPSARAACFAEVGR